MQPRRARGHTALSAQLAAWPGAAGQASLGVSHRLALSEICLKRRLQTIEQRDVEASGCDQGAVAIDQ